MAGVCHGCGRLFHKCPEIPVPEAPPAAAYAEMVENQRVTRSALEASALLTRAAQLTAGKRAAQHGPKERNHQNIADHWNAYLAGRLDRPLTALDVALLMIELKIARTKCGFGLTNEDNYVDMAGYAGIAGEIALREREVPVPESAAVTDPNPMSPEEGALLGEGGSYITRP